MVKRGKHARRMVGRKLTVVGIVAVVALVVVGGTAFAAMRYDSSTSSEILPGIQISGIDVGGMTRAQALSAVKKATNKEL